MKKKREKPMLFSGPLVRAVLNDTKTQTRRPVKVRSHGKMVPPFPPYWEENDGELWFQDEYGDYIRYCDHNRRFGSPGDKLWVRETFCVVDDTEFEGDIWVDYRATPKYNENAPGGWDKDETAGDPQALKWRPSIHMPRWASRIILEMTNVRVERLQDISVDDCLAEGVDDLDLGAVSIASHGAEVRRRFASLWDDIYAKQGLGWDKNPWVWVVTFKRIPSADEYLRSLAKVFVGWCAACSSPAEGNFSIHRDGFDKGPEVPLCDECGGKKEPSCERLWDMIREQEEIYAPLREDK